MTPDDTADPVYWNLKDFQVPAKSGDLTPDDLAKLRERDSRGCVWDEGAVPDHVARFLWDAVHDRHKLLAALAAAEERVKADLLVRLRETFDAPYTSLTWTPDGVMALFEMLLGGDRWGTNAANLLAAVTAERDALAEGLMSFVDDPVTFATDPDGDCWHCGGDMDPDEHDVDNTCPVTVGRTLLAAHRARVAAPEEPDA